MCGGHTAQHVEGHNLCAKYDTVAGMWDYNVPPIPVSITDAAAGSDGLHVYLIGGKQWTDDV